MPNGMKQAMYRLGPISKFIRSSLNKSMPSGIHPAKISAGILQGMQMHLDLQSEKDYWLGTYEIPLIEHLQTIGEKGMVAYDLGANIGYISLALAKIIGSQGKVFAFEALPKNVDRLRDNVASNEMQDRITVIPKAIAQSSGQATFLVHRSGGMGKLAISKGREESYENEVNVPAIALDDFVYEEGNPPPKIIKMDIEGAEGAALAGMRRLLSEQDPVLLIEMHGPEASRSAWEELKELGYQIRSLNNPASIINSIEELDWKSYVLAEAIND